MYELSEETNGVSDLTRRMEICSAIPFSFLCDLKIIDKITPDKKEEFLNFLFNVFDKKRVFENSLFMFYTFAFSMRVRKYL